MCIVTQTPAVSVFTSQKLPETPVMIYKQEQVTLEKCSCSSCWILFKCGQNTFCLCKNWNIFTSIFFPLKITTGPYKRDTFISKNWDFVKPHVVVAPTRCNRKEQKESKTKILQSPREIWLVDGKLTKTKLRGKMVLAPFITAAYQAVTLWLVISYSITCSISLLLKCNLKHKFLFIVTPEIWMLLGWSCFHKVCNSYKSRILINMWVLLISDYCISIV